MNRSQDFQPSPHAAHSGASDRVTRVRYFVLVWLCAAATIAYIQRAPLALVVTSVQADLGLSDRSIGAALTAFFVMYALFQVPGGWLADRWGSRATLTGVMATCSLATMFQGGAFGLLGLGATRAAAGTGQAAIFPAATNTMARWFSRHERAIASGWLSASMSLGNMVATLLIGWMLLYMSWRWIFVLCGLPGLAWALGFYLWFRNRPEEHAAVGAGELAIIRGRAASAEAAAGDAAQSDPDDAPEPTPWRALATSQAMWLIATQQFFRAAGYALFMSWYSAYLQRVYDVTESEAAFWAAIPLAAVVIGSPLGGILSDRLLRHTGSRKIGRKATAIVAMAGAAATFAAASQQSHLLPAALLIAVGAFCGAIPGPIVYAMTIDMGGRHVGTVFSLMNMGGNVGAAVFPIALGWAFQSSGRWDLVPLVVAGIYAAGTACWIPLNPNGTVFDPDDRRVY